jgi:hypothetical protein
VTPFKSGRTRADAGRMLRIDETSKTLAAPEPPSFVAEPALHRDELHALLSSGWELFAAEIGQPHLRFLAVEPAPGVDMLAFDETAGTVAVVVVTDAVSAEVVGRALAAAAEVASWDAARLAAVHEDLQAAVPHESPKVVFVAAEAPDGAVALMDFLVRRHGHELSAHVVRMLRFGSDRMMDVARAYPAPDASAAPSQAPDFFARVAHGSVPAPGISAPPPGIPTA